MASLGELFIELGVVGDTKELDKALNTMKETIKAVDKQIQQSQQLRRYREQLANATGKSEKDAIKDEFALATKKNIEANEELKNNIAGFVKGITDFITAVSGAIGAVNKLTNQLVQSNQAFLNLTRTSDISLDTFQKWDSVGKMLGVQNAAQQIEGLNERLYELMLTGQGVEDFQLAEINPINADGVMEQIRNHIKGMSDTSASYLLKEMGLDPQMLHLLRMSREEFQALNAEMANYRLTPEQRASIQEMNIQLEMASQKLQYLKERAILAIMPYFVRFTEMMTEIADGIRTVVRWLNNSKSELATLTRLIIAATVALAGIVAVIKTLPLLIGGITIAIRILQGAIMSLTAHPIIAGLTALLGAIMLIADDIMGYFQGKNSGIGYIINGLEDLNIKGFIDFPVPEWLAALIKVIDFFSGNANKRLIESKVTQDFAKLDPKAGKIKFADGSYAFAEIPPEFVDKLKQSDIGIRAIQNLPYNAVSPSTLRNINNNDNRMSSTNSNNTIYQNNYIETQQPVQTIQDLLPFTQRAFSFP